MILTRLDSGVSDERDIAISYVSSEKTLNTHDATVDVFLFSVMIFKGFYLIYQTGSPTRNGLRFP